MSRKLEPVFKRLRAILQKNAGSLSVADDTPDRFCLLRLFLGSFPEFPVSNVKRGEPWLCYAANAGCWSGV